ncbi:FixH family protein [Bacillus sp. NTK071]|uniref:FixH family protein n=1 Tax=Bacillus sp. NTK071 TaxID=2802175 RepID=UPI001A8FF31F|nr:FixH family protein [Bacillus sp. NTK071]MBN8209068.1 FixH family protein [Bacillus sp. NTK071]
MKKVSLVIGIVFLLALAACSGTADNSLSNDTMANETSEEQMNNNDNNSTEAGEAMESNDEVEEMSGPTLDIVITENSSDDEGDHGDHHGSELGIMLKADEMDSTLLTTTVTEGKQSLTEANVRFEYWEEGEEQHTYTDAEEKGEGMYEGKIEISEPRTYMLKVHVEKGEELHTHKPYVLNVTEK